jgi:hypothetical protein
LRLLEELAIGHRALTRLEGRAKVVS